MSENPFIYWTQKNVFIGKQLVFIFTFPFWEYDYVYHFQ